MKRNIWKVLLGLVLAFTAGVNAYSANGFIDTTRYDLCAGDTLNVALTTGKRVQFYSDSIVFDTIHVTSNTEDSIHTYIVRLRPVFLVVEPIRVLPLGGSLVWHDSTITTEGTYQKVYESKYHCDSIYRVTVYRLFIEEEQRHICQGEETEWRGQKLSQPGTYDDIVRSKDGLRDSIIYRLQLSTQYVPETYITHSICRGSYYDWRTQHLTEQGTYHDTLMSYMGCDSIVHLTLNILDVDTTLIVRQITEGESIEWEGETISEAGVYDKTKKNIYDCDSIVRLIVTSYPVDTIKETAVICQGQTYAWHGLNVNRAGTYYTADKPSGSTKTIYRLDLTVKEVPHSYIYKTICAGTTLEYNGKSYNKSGMYTDTIPYQDCDSIIHLTVTILDPDINIQYSRIPEGSSVDWNGETYKEAGVYDKVSTNRFGCDSIARLVLTTYHVDTIDTVIILCPNESYTWHGMMGNQTHVYEFPGTKENGDQVIYRMDLTVKELIHREIPLTICDGETIDFHGKTYVNEGEYDEQYTCDTLFKVKVTKHPTKLHVQEVVLDRTNPYYWRYVLDGEQKVDTILERGIYEHMTHDPETGCNEIYRLIATKDETSYHYITDTVICENEYFEWRGKKNLNRQGIGTTTHYFDRYRTKADQDSIYELILKVQPVPRVTQTIKFCESIEWGGVTYTESTVLADTLQSMQYHCDSIVTIQLIKGIPFHKHDTATIRPGESITWRGHLITTDGQYKDTYTTAAGCDSIYSLGVGLEEVPVPTPTRTWRESICEGDFYTWEVDQQKYYNSGTFVDTVWVNSADHSQGVDSLHILILTVNQKYEKRERITFHSFPGTYRGHVFNYDGEEFTFTYTTAGGCDSVIIVKAEFEIAHYEETVVICPGETFVWDWDGLTYKESGRYVKTIPDQSDKDSVEHILNLTVKYIPDTYIRKTICKGGSYTFGDRTLTESGNYDYTFHETGCDSVVHLALNVLSPDTIRYVHHMNEHDSYVWHGETYKETGVYYFHGTNRFGCDSLEILQLTVNHVDTIDTVAVICPNEIPFVWHGITARQSGKFSGVEENDGVVSYYRLDLTVRELITLDTTFTICGDQSVTFHGQTYSESGRYPNYIACDTVVYVNIVNHPQQVYETRARMTDDHGYHWTYWDNGTKHENVLFDKPGTYEYESPNAETGCSEVWRLILTLDENEYHFVEELTICEGDDFTWHGLTGLSGITGTNTYRVEYETHAGKDSIYELTLTVVPVERTVRTIVFCGETEWNGTTYTNSAVVYDTISLPTGCYRIERINLNKAQSYYFRESKEWPQGKVLHWHGQNITTDGVYYDRLTTVQGCDSVYEITVTIIPAAPETNQYAEELSACEGDTITWRGKEIWRSGTYVDTVWADGKLKVDSIFTLSFTAWPAPKDTIYQHLYSCKGNPIYYNGQDYIKPDTIVTKFHTIHGCDSIVKAYFHFNEVLAHDTDTVIITDKQLPYRWQYKLSGESIELTGAGTYHHTVVATGGCVNEEHLHLIVYPTYLFEKDTTICEADLPFLWIYGPAGNEQQEYVQHTIGQTKQYEHRFKTIYETDSIYRLNLTINAQPKAHEYYQVCAGSPRNIRGKVYGNIIGQTDTVYNDTIPVKTENSICDSIVYVHVTVSAPAITEKHVIIHVGETISWRDTTIKTLETRTYEQREANATTLCEDIYRLHVVAEQHDDDTICVTDTATYMWLNKYKFRASGLYYDTVFDANHFVKEFHSLQLTVQDVPFSRVQVTICEGDEWTSPSGKKYFNLKADSVYFDTVPFRIPSSRCDSIVYYEIRQVTVPTKTETKILHTGETITWHGKTITSGGMVEDRVPGVAESGCDSVYYLNVIEEMTYTDTICELDIPYTWRSFNLQTSGYYTDTAFDAQGHITGFWSLHLKVATVPYSRQVVTICEGEEWTSPNGKKYFNLVPDSIYRDTLPISPVNKGCDSLVYYEIRQITIPTKTETKILHDGETITWHGKTITSGGMVEDRVEGVADGGCDSLYYLNVIQEMHENPVICIRDTPYVWHGQNIFTSGYYTDTVFDPQGHITEFWGINLQVDTIPTRVQREYVCAGVPLTLYINNELKTYGAPGMPTDTMYRDTVYHRINEASKCDSTIFYEIYVSSVQERHQTIIIPKGSTYEFGEKTLSKAGTYRDTTDTDDGCFSIQVLHLVVEETISKTICIADTLDETPEDKKYPYVWKHTRPGVPNDTLYTSGTYTDTTFDDEGYIKEYYSLDLTIAYPYDTTIYVHGCQKHDFIPGGNNKQGAWWYGQPNEIFWKDTAFIYRKPVEPADPNAPCDSVFYVNIVMDTIYDYYIQDTICEHDLPYILGRIDPDTIWGPTLTNPGQNEYTHNDVSVHGCDSIIHLTLTIIPSLPKNDSTFVCQEYFTDGGYLWFGDTISPAFDAKWHGKWEGKWHGVPIANDTTLYDCDSSLFHRIIVEPIREVTKDTFYLCQGDSVQLFWPNKDTWVKEQGVYYDTLAAYSSITNKTHQPEGYAKNYLCDSIIEWTVFMLDTIHKDSTVHIRQGDSIWFNNQWYRIAGDYDSISYAGPAGVTPGQTAIQGPNSLELPLQDSRKQYCKYVMTLHLFVDTVYRYNDTITICEVANKDMTYVFDDHFDENNHFKFNYKTPADKTKDTAILHYADSLQNIEYRFYDHYYNLTVFYSQIYQTVIKDTICYGDSLKFDQHWMDIENNVTNERYVKVAGVYHDTLRAFNGCDSIIELHLEVRDPIDTTYQNVSVIDRELPYVWNTTWAGNGGGTNSLQLYEEGTYRDTLPSIFGCDSVIVLNLKVIPTHLYRDTIDTCALPNITITHHWAETGYDQKYTTPLRDQDTTYKDTIVKNDHDSLFYELLVHFHQIRDTLLFDTICEGGALRFDSLGGNYERWISKEGRYSDTLTAVNGCDSIVTLQLYVRDRIPVTHKSVTITDREAPYYWSHTWFNQETGKDTTYKDTLRTSGEYTYLMPSIHGCDSLDSISFTVHETHVFHDTITVCSPIDRTLSHVWNFAPNYEQIFTVPNHDVDTTYLDTLPTVFYLDSIYALYVHYHVLDSTVLHTSICEGDSLRFGDIQGVPRFLTAPGIYRDTLTRVTNGCDSIVVMYLNVYQKHLFHQQVDIADVDTPFVWAHSWMEGAVLKTDTDSLYISGEYSRVLPSIYGCDSIDSLSLRIHKTYHIYEDTINICYNQTPFTWQGLDNITATGDYQWGGQTVDKYDSVRYVHINVWKQVYDTISAQICEGDSMRFGFTDESHTTPRFVTTPGLYNDTLQNVHGCDSIIVLRLNVYPKLLFHKQVDIADVDTPYAWPHSWMENGVLKKDTDRVYAAGEYRRVLPSVLGCDSIDSLTLVIHPTYLFHDSVTICYNETPYTWYNADQTEIFQEGIYETGTYIKRLQTHDHYDSTYVRYVRVIPVHKDTVRHEMCEGTDYLFNGVRYTEDGTYTDTLTTADGCDSIVTLILKVNKSIYVRVPVDIYEGENYTFYGQPYSTSGTYRHYGTTDAGCDSIVELFLTVHKDVDTIVTICQSELPYNWINKWSGESKLLYQAGKYRNDTTYVNGVRTFYTLQLVVNEPLFDTIRTTICEGDDYYFNGVQYKEAGIYRDTLRAANGCDSIETLILSVNKPYYNIIREDILEGSYYVFYGDTLRETTTKTHGALTPSGCDSTTVLQLTVHPLVDTIATVCRNDLPFVWTNRWNGNTEKYYNGGLYRNDTTINGQKYFYGLQVNVLEQVFDTIHAAICEGSYYKFKGANLTEPGIYRDTTDASNGCDSITTLILTVNKPYYNLIKEDVLEGGFYVFYGDTLRETTTKTHSTRTPEGCDSTTVLQLTVHPLVDTIATVCRNDLPFVWTNRWNGNTEKYYNGGLYRNDTTINGQKYFYGLQINVLEQVFDTIRHSMCEGGSYTFKNNTYTEAGIYRDTLMAENGCDSIVTLILTVNKAYYNIIEEDILEGQYYVFYGDTLRETTTINHSARTPEGCDSTTVLQLTVHHLIDTVVNICSNELPYIWTNRWNGNTEKYYRTGLYRNDTTINGKKFFYGLDIHVNEQVFDTIRHSMCEGGTYTFKNNTYTEAGIYRDTLMAENGCDSIVTLILTVNKAYYHIIEEDILEGQYYVFYGDTLRETTTINHSARTPEGCDSTTVLQLTVHHLVDTVVNVCSNELPYIWTNRWNGNTEKYYRTGLYRNDTTINGKKFFYGLDIHVNEQVFDTIRHSMCEGGSYTFKNNTYSEAGIYRDTLMAENGCDSIVTLILTVNKAYYHIIEEDILEGQYYVFYGDTLRETTTINHSARTPEGCDSTTVLQLTVHHLIDTVVTVCSNDLPYIWTNRWNGNTEKYYRTGLYRNDTTINGKKFFYGLDIHVNEQVFDTIRHSMCEGGTYTFKNNTYTEAGIYRDTLMAENGCDSIVTLILTVNKAYYNIIEEDILEGQYYVFYGDTLRETTTINHSARTPEGCDSTTVLQLTVHHLIDTVVTVCSNDLPYIWTNRWNGNTEKYYRTGLYRNDTTINGKKFFYGLDIHVNEQVFDTIRHSMCEGGTYTFKNNTYTEAGIYRDTLMAENGCDSIVTLILTVNKAYYNIIEEDILEGQYYVFYGDTIRETTTINHSARTPEGCDSTTVLQLTVHHLIDTVVTVCSNDLPYVWTNRWNGNTEKYYRTGLYRNDTTINGKKFFYGLDIHVNEQVFDTIRHSMCEGGTYTFKNNTYTEAGIYRDTLMAENGCDSIVTLILTVNKAYYHIIEEDILEGQYYVFYGDTLRETTTINHSARTPEGCDSTTVLQLTVHHLVDTVVNVCSNDLPYIWTNRWSGNTEKYYRTGLYRNDTTINGKKYYYGLQINVGEQVFDTTRVAICEGSFYRYREINLYEQGIYRDTLVAANGCDSIHTLVLTVNKPYYNMIHEDILEGGYYVFYGDTLRESTTINHSGRTPEGCDSTTVLQLTVHPMVDSVVTICSNDLPYVWTNRWSGEEEKYYRTGLYRNDTVIDGKRLFFGLDLRVNEQIFDTIRHAMCEGSSYEFAGKVIYDEGIYRDTLVSKASGCDSIVTLILTVNKPYYNIIRETILEGHFYVFFGDTIRETRAVTHTSRTPQGCDSTTILELTVHQLVDTVVTICANDLPYVWTNKWNGLTETFYKEGTYRNDTSINGERYFYGLQLVVNQPAFDTIRHTMCEGDFYQFRNQPVYEAGIYRDTLNGPNGCDSIVTLILTVNKPYYNYRVDHIIEGDSVLFFGDWYKETGTFTHNGKKIGGCDSTSVLELHVHPMVDTVVTVCSSDLPYKWENPRTGTTTLLYAAGIYRNDTSVVNGERLFYGLQLNVRQPSDTTIYREICEGDSYSFNGKDISVGGEYRDTLRNAIGCDSVIILHLNVLKKYHNVVYHSIFEGDSVEFQGEYYKTAGSYPFRFTSSFGCDSIIELQLTVNRLFDDSISVCSNELPYTWHGKTINESGIYRDTVINTEGKKTTIGLKVTVLPTFRAPEPIVATICEGDFYKFGDNVLTVQGTYYDTLTAVNGCDSIIMLALQVMPAKHLTETKTIFEGDTVIFHGEKYWKSGIYTYKETNNNGCVDLYELVLTVMKEFKVDTTAYVCANNLPFIWHGYEFSETGVYEIPTAWTDSSRVVTTLHLEVREAPYREIHVQLCYGNSFIVNNDVITESGTYDYIVPTPQGCDSTIRYIVSVHNKFERWDTVHISDQQFYPFVTPEGVRNLTIPGDYEYTGKTVGSGCDSIVHIHLEVHPSYYFKDSIEICRSDANYPYVWKNVNDSIIATIYETGTYKDEHLTMRYGFDSIYELKVTVHDSYLYEEMYELGTGETVDFHGKLIDKAGIYYDSLLSVHGCDSIYRMIVNPKRVREFTWVKTICQGEFFEMPDGTKYDKSGNYKYLGQDSIVYLNLTVIPVNYTQERIVITDKMLDQCGGPLGCTYLHTNGILYTGLQIGPNVREEYSASGTKCDNIHRTIIVVTQDYSDWELIPLCEGSQVEIDGIVFTHPCDTQIVCFNPRTGEMDYIHRVRIYKANAFEFPTDTFTICRGDTLEYAGKLFTEPDNYEIKYKSVTGCDSIYHLVLRVKPAQTTIQEETIRDFETFTWDKTGTDYKNAGDYLYKEENASGCFDKYILRLKVIPTQVFPHEATICKGEEYPWRDSTYSEPGEYADTVYRPQNNFSAIYVLYLKVLQPTSIEQAEASEMCGDDKEFTISFTCKDNEKPAYCSVYFDPWAKSEGFVDVINQPLYGNNYITVPAPSRSKNDTLPMGQSNYIRPGYYPIRLVLGNGTCGESTKDNIELVVKYPSWIIMQQWDDVVAPLKKEYNGGYEFSLIEWTINDSKRYNNGLGYLHNDNLQPGDEVVMWATRKGDTKAIPTCPLIIQSLSPNNVMSHVVVYPSMAPKHAPQVTLEATESGEYAIYSSMGTFIGSGTFESGTQQVVLPSNSGIYFIRAKQGKEETTHKVVLY